jgi:hypothetical protein
LLAGADHDTAPVALLLLRLLVVEAYDAACREHGRDGRDAELGRLLQRPVHALAARDALHERDLERRLRGGRGGLAQAHCYLVAGDACDLGPVLLAGAIEDAQRRAFPHPQHARDVIRAGRRQLQLSARRERPFAIQPGDSHAGES